MKAYTTTERRLNVEIFNRESTAAADTLINDNQPPIRKARAAKFAKSKHVHREMVVACFCLRDPLDIVAIGGKAQGYAHIGIIDEATLISLRVVPAR